MEHLSLQRKYVFDAVLRVLHWWNALCIVALVFTGLGAKWFLSYGDLRTSFWLLHGVAGKGLILGIVGRIVWALAGPYYARLARFLPLSSLTRSHNESWGHPPKANLVYLTFYVGTLGMTLTGLVLDAGENMNGPLFPLAYDSLVLQRFAHITHHLSSYLFVVFVVAHLGALVIHEKKEGLPFSQSMLSGFQYKKNASPTEDAR